MQYIVPELDLKLKANACIFVDVNIPAVIVPGPGYFFECDDDKGNDLGHSNQCTIDP